MKIIKKWVIYNAMRERKLYFEQDAIYGETANKKKAMRFDTKEAAAAYVKGLIDREGNGEHNGGDTAEIEIAHDNQQAVGKLKNMVYRIKIFNEYTISSEELMWYVDLEGGRLVCTKLKRNASIFLNFQDAKSKEKYLKNKFKDYDFYIVENKGEK